MLKRRLQFARKLRAVIIYPAINIRFSTAKTSFEKCYSKIGAINIQVTKIFSETLLIQILKLAK